jgi:undecaprenyl diphosphate synthase
MKMNKLDKNRIPRHIAIIMDGNGRWATERNQPRAVGHQAGVETVRKITAECVRLGVKYLTLYTFSTENWNRPAEEVAALMGLMLESLKDDLLMKNNVRLEVIGDMERLPKEVREATLKVVDETKNNSNMSLVLALSYSSKWEITEAVKQIARETRDQQLTVAEIDEELVSKRLATADMPDPELLIRTGGELRISNFLLWQIAYSELYFCNTYWPDFSEEHLHEAIANYQSRQRRFGKTEAQVEEESKK